MGGIVLNELLFVKWIIKIYFWDNEEQDSLFCVINLFHRGNIVNICGLFNHDRKRGILVVASTSKKGNDYCVFHRLILKIWVWKSAAWFLQAVGFWGIFAKLDNGDSADAGWFVVTQCF